MKARLASRNQHKLIELRQALPDWQIEALDVEDYPAETGATYVANARGKARHGKAFAPAGEWVLGEDSGIEASALGGRPGLASARWADDGVARLLDELTGIEDRRARFVSAIVAIGPSGKEFVVDGTLAGSIADAPRGSGGFGYDPILVPDGETLTVAELGDGWKARNSHRARAAAALVAAIR